MATKRTAVVLISNFALAVFAKAQRSRAHGAIALVDMIDDTSPVVAVNDDAAQSGITCGMTAAQAQAFCPGLAVYKRDLIAERAEAQAITGWLGALSPTVHEESSGLFQLDASGMMLLYRDESAYADKIIATLRPLGHAIQVGVANNSFVARVAAERAEPDDYLIVAPRNEKQFLSGLGREYLVMSAETDSLLHDLGIEQMAQVSAIPLNEMTERFGGEGNTLVTLARGENLHSHPLYHSRPPCHSRESGNPVFCRSKSLAPKGSPANGGRGFDILRQVGAPDATGSSFHSRPPCHSRESGNPSFSSDDNTQFTTTRFFSAPLEQTAYLRRHLNQLLGDLLERLKSFGQGCACVEIILHLDNRTEQTISLAVEKPTASVRLFLRQWQTQSETLRLDSGITGITVAIPHLHPLLIEQTALATHREQSTAPVALPDSVHYPQLRSEILPESCFDLTTKKKMSKPRPLAADDRAVGAARDFDLQDSKQQMKSPQCLHSVVARSDFTLSLSKGPSRRSNLNHQRRWESIGLRLLQPPRPVRMQTHHNQPVDFIWAGRHRTIIRAAGPWELSGQWWQTGFHRRYYEIIVDTCQRYLIFCDETDPRWFVQGVFD